MGRKNFSFFLNFIFTQFATTFLLVIFEFEQIQKIVIFKPKNSHILKEKIFFQLFFEFHFSNFFIRMICNNFSFGHFSFWANKNFHSFFPLKNWPEAKKIYLEKNFSEKRNILIFWSPTTLKKRTYGLELMVGR